MAKRMRVPGKAEWAGYEEDLDSRHAHKLFFGKTAPEVFEYFASGRAIERAAELWFIPRKAFQYYVVAFAEYLMSAEAKGGCDAASSFLRLLISREKRDPGSVVEIYPKLAKTVDFLAANQEHFDAEIDIYGSFADLAHEIRKVCNKHATGNA